MGTEIVKHNPHVVIVDDEADLCELLAMRLEHHGYRTTIKLTCRDAISFLSSETIDAMIVDLRLEDGSGLDVLNEVQKRSSDIPVVILTAHGTVEIAVKAMEMGAYGFLTKPFHDHELLQKLAHAVESARLRREVAGLRQMAGDLTKETKLLGTSSEINNVRDLIGRIAPSDVTVLILGESGTGKELAARAIHANSMRKDYAFVALNCAALPGDLLESELFGYVKGAFTGANRDKEGLFAAARGGTLFLDEIGDASASVQARLLRVLQERSYTPIGSTKEEIADVRIIAATNRDLLSAVKDGEFREDLFYRLHVVPITMPPLRERMEDIPLLAEVFLSRVAAGTSIEAPQLTPDAMSVIRAHSWPGNVRELANVIEGAVLLATQNKLNGEDIKQLLALQPEVSTFGMVGKNEMYPETQSAHDRTPEILRSLFDNNKKLPPLRAAREAFERSYLAEVLRRSGGNVSAAAKLAGRNRTDFHDLMRKHGVSAATFKENN
jgi:two-component system, NtrC family, response regulator GlrR